MPPISQMPAPELKVRVAEKIDGELYEQGTIAELTALSGKADKLTDLRYRYLSDSLDTSFSKMQDNLNDYLAWYYKLPDNPVELGKLWYEGMEPGLKLRLNKELTKGEPFKDFEVELRRLKDTEAALAALDRQGQETLLNGRVSINPSEHLVTGHPHSSKEFARLFRPTRARFAAIYELRDFAQTPGRIAASLATHAESQSAKNPIIREAPDAARNVGAFKLAAETMSMVAGAVVGAVAGSSLPGPGTVTGGAVGRLGGKKAADKWGPRLENEVSAQAFRTAIRTPLDNRRMEIREKLVTALKN